MSSQTTDNTNLRCAAEAGQNFIDFYYPAINSSSPASSSSSANANASNANSNANNKNNNNTNANNSSSSSSKSKIHWAYVCSNATYTSTPSCPSTDISVNGLLLSSPDELEAALAKSKQNSGPADRTVRYAVESFTTSVINPDYNFACPADLLQIHGPTDGVRIMFALNVSGTVYYGVDKNSRDNNGFVAKKHFNDVFILVPNWDVIGKATKGGTGSSSSSRHVAGRKYLVLSHTHRAFDA